MSNGKCSYIPMYINAVSDTVMLYLRDFYNIIFKINHKLYRASGLASVQTFGRKTERGKPVCWRGNDIENCFEERGVMVKAGLMECKGYWHTRADTLTTLQVPRRYKVARRYSDSWRAEFVCHFLVCLNRSVPNVRLDA
jgi:hypothetical protein